MKKIEVDCGFKSITDNNEVIKYEGNSTAQGFCYVDIKAFHSGEGLCFISEGGLEDFDTAEELNITHEVSMGGCDTRQSLLECVFDCYELDKRKKIDKRLAEDIALDFLQWSVSEGWCCSQTALLEWAEDFDYDEVVEGYKLSKVG